MGSNGSNSSNDSLMNTQQAAQYLNMPRSTLYKKTCSNQIPCYKPAGRVMFSKTELDSWLKKGR